jgi:L-fuculose-phosphate aldolase
MKNIETLKQEMVEVGRRLYQTGLTVAKSGNISCRLDSENILISSSETFLGKLSYDDIVQVNLVSLLPTGQTKASSELPLHSLIYNNFKHKAVIHAHPPLINGYFAVCDSLKALTFETKFYLGEIPVIPQEAPTVTKPEPVIEALKNNNIVVLKNHGVVAVSDNFNEALSLIEALEEAIKSAGLARLFKKDLLDDLDKGLKNSLTKGDNVYDMFSKEHIQAIVDLVNKDAFIAEKGRDLDLTVKLAITLDDSDKAYTFNFEKGRIISLDQGSNAPFIISASNDIWQQVFLGKLDSFVAVTQGKMKLQGQLGQLSKWYVPFTRLFQLFKEVKFK